MIIVKLMGGLGNQMFQYAFGKYLATKHNTELKIDTSFLLDRTIKKEHFVFRNYDLDIFNLTVEVASAEEAEKFTKRSSNQSFDRVLTKISGTKKNHLKHMDLTFDPAHLNAGPNTYLEGYWQSEKYFQSIADTLKLEDFSFRKELQPNAKELHQKIEACNAVCINVRRGDFVTNDFHGAMGIDYYKKAESILLEKNPDAKFFVFSDEVDWCEENLKFSVPTTFVSHDYAGEKFQDYLRLMAACKHFIIPNSSFAWWAVWFNNNPNKMVVAPKKWINDPNNSMDDLVPSSWIRI